MLKVISLMGAPGTGKSTLAHGLFYFIRCQFPYIKAEFVSEYAKEMVWKGEPFTSQVYISGNQYQRMEILRDKVDLIVNECCLLNGYLYADTWESYDGPEYLWPLFKRFDNYVIHTGPPPSEYEDVGRIHNYKQSLKIHKDGIQWAKDVVGYKAGKSLILNEFTLASTVLNNVIDSGFLDDLIRK